MINPSTRFPSSAHPWLELFVEPYLRNSSEMASAPQSKREPLQATASTLTLSQAISQGLHRPGRLLHRPIPALAEARSPLPAGYAASSGPYRQLWVVRHQY